MLRVATDIGGTFTDLVFVTPDGKVVTGKSHTTPAQFEKGVMDVISASDIKPSEFASFVHGTTIVINAITERKGAKVGLLGGIDGGWNGDNMKISFFEIIRIGCEHDIRGFQRIPTHLSGTVMMRPQLSNASFIYIKPDDPAQLAECNRDR